MCAVKLIFNTKDMNIRMTGMDYNDNKTNFYHLN